MQFKKSKFTNRKNFFNIKNFDFEKQTSLKVTKYRLTTKY